nr:hypothetical protein [uncultured Agrobacterium sp.]
MIDFLRFTLAAGVCIGSFFIPKMVARFWLEQNRRNIPSHIDSGDKETDFKSRKDIERLEDAYYDSGEQSGAIAAIFVFILGVAISYRLFF